MRSMQAANPDLSRRELRQLFRLARPESTARQTPPMQNPAAHRAAAQHLINNIPRLNRLQESSFNRLAETQSTFVAANGTARSITRGLELDLTSNERGITLGDTLFSDKSSYKIYVGGEQRELSSGSTVSAAEYIALQQVIDNGSQSLDLDSSGRAIGGSFALSSIDDGGRDIHAKSLVVPTSVLASGDFSRQSDFRLTGDLTNLGNIIAESNHSGNNRVDIFARDITNGAGASIETSASSRPMDLHLRAERNFRNEGLISSSGNLSISAGTNLQNLGTVRGQSLNIDAPSVTNSGALDAVSGNINFDCSLPSNIAIDNSGGTISALQGSIRVRAEDYSEKFSTTVKGGDWLSSQVQLNAGDGDLSVNVNKLTGEVRARAGTAIINAQTDVLNIQALQTSGDPLISNTNTVILGGEQVTGGAPLTVVSGQDIILDNAVLITNSNVTGAGNIMLIAGAAFTVNSGNIEVTGASASGGNIGATGAAPVILASGNGPAGNVTLAAFASAPNTGQINLPFNSSIIAVGDGQPNGTITFIAGGGMQLGRVDTTVGTTTGTGSIIIHASQPQVVGPFAIDSTTGAVLSGGLDTGTVIGDVVLQGALKSAANIQINAVNFSNLYETTTAQGSITIAAENSIALGSNLMAQDITLSAPNGISQTLGRMFTPADGTLTINLVGSNPRDADLSVGNGVGTLIGQGEGTIIFNNGLSPLKLGSIGPTQSLRLSLDGSVLEGVSYLGGINTTGTVNIATRRFSANGNNLTAASINISSPRDELWVDGGIGGSLTATSPLPGPPGSPSSPPAIRLAAFTGGDLILEGTMNLSGDVELDSTAELISANGSLFVGANNVTIGAGTWIQQGNGNITGNNLAFAGTAIINPDGDVVLKNNLVFSGRDLVIAARDNVDLSYYHIDLSSSTGDGGSLTILAGYDLSGAGSGQIQTSQLFNVSLSSRVGNIYGSGFYNTSSTAAGGNAGDVSIAATGTIILTGNIDSNAISGQGGTISITAPEGINLTSYVTASSWELPLGGDASIRAGVANTLGLVYYRNGESTGPGFISFRGGELTNGPISIFHLDAFSVDIRNKTAPITIGGIQPHLLNIQTEGSISLTGNSLYAYEVSDLGGSITINAPLISTSFGPLQLIANGLRRAGTINFSSPGNLFVSNSGGADLYIEAKTFMPLSSSDGGVVNLSAVGSLVVDAGGLRVGLTDTINLTANSSGGRPGEVLIYEDLAAGALNIHTESKTPFTITSLATVGNSRTPTNAVVGTLTVGKVFVENTLGAIEIADPSSLIVGDLALRTYGKNSIEIPKNAVLSASNSITLKTESRDIGRKDFFVNAPILELSTTGGAAKVTSVYNGEIELQNTAVAKSLTLSAAQGLNVNGATTERGSITLTANGGTLTVSGPLKAQNGGVSLLNTDTTNGDIILGDQVETSGKSKDIIIAIGKLQKTNANNAPTTFLTVNEERGGKVRFGPGGVVPVGPASITAIKRSVYFNDQGAGDIVITTGSNVRAESN